MSDLENAMRALSAFADALADARVKSWSEMAYIRRLAWRYLRMLRMAGYL